ncbi:MAG: hypothetical protein JJ975_17495 [Bacteroidia bacterium]|nr:hypothetical protein [Bacteroidia bacterium]
MKLSKIKLWLTGKLSDHDIRLVLQPKMSNYLRALSKKGSSARIEVTEDEKFKLTEMDQPAFSNSALSDTELSYIANALLLSEWVNIENDDVFTFIEAYAEPNSA